MAVYVDPLFSTRGPSKPSGRWPHPQACHLTADSHEELEAFARRLRLRPEWIQHPNHPFMEHYDLTASMRAKAVAAGATEISREEAAAMTRRLIEAMTRRLIEAQREKWGG